jgi:hypothetical protein
MSSLTEARKEKMSALMRLSRQLGVASGATGKKLLRGERFLAEEEGRLFDN